MGLCTFKYVMRDRASSEPLQVLNYYPAEHKCGDLLTWNSCMHAYMYIGTCELKIYFVDR